MALFDMLVISGVQVIKHTFKTKKVKYYQNQENRTLKEYIIMKKGHSLQALY